MTVPALDVLREARDEIADGAGPHDTAGFADSLVSRLDDALTDLDALVQAGWDVVASQGGPDSLRVLADRLSRVTGEAR